MGIFDRMKTVISSNINDMINKAENPEKMLNQLVIEMNQQMIESKKSAPHIVVLHLDLELI